jgi:hypothetical protein
MSDASGVAASQRRVIRSGSSHCTHLLLRTRVMSSLRAIRNSQARNGTLARSS